MFPKRAYPPPVRPLKRLRAYAWLPTLLTSNHCPPQESWLLSLSCVPGDFALLPQSPGALSESKDRGGMTDTSGCLRPSGDLIKRWVPWRGGKSHCANEILKHLCVNPPSSAEADATCHPPYPLLAFSRPEPKPSSKGKDSSVTIPQAIPLNQLVPCFSCGRALFFGVTPVIFFSPRQLGPVS